MSCIEIHDMCVIIYYDCVIIDSMPCLFIMSLGLSCHMYIYHVSSTLTMIMHHILPCLFIYLLMYYAMPMHHYIYHIVIMCLCKYIVLAFVCNG